MADGRSERWALVTGGTSGIGLALADALVKEGFRTALGSRDAGRAEAAAKAVGAALPLAMDVADHDSVTNAFAALEKQAGRLDVLVNNAGVGRFADLADTSEADWLAMIGTNLTGTWRVTKRALPLLLAAEGMIVNVVSVGGRKAFPGSSAYCASKFGMLGLAESLREEVRSRGVRVVNLLPGATDTPFWAHIEGDWDRSRMIRPEDVAAAMCAALRMPAGALIEEIVIAPAGGSL